MPKQKQRPATPLQYISQAQFAKILGVSRQRITALIAAGLPKRKDGKIDREEGLAWVQSHVLPRNGAEPGAQGSLLKVRVDRELIRLELDRLELARQQGLMVTVDDVEREWTGMVSTCRTRLLSIPSKVAPMLAAESNAAACQELVRTALHEALEELGREPEPGLRNEA